MKLPKNLHNPHELRDQDGNILSNLALVKAGDAVYKLVSGKLVKMTVTKLNPFTAQTIA